MVKGRMIRLLIGAALLGATVAGASVASAAPHGAAIPQGIWIGKSSQGMRVTFNVLRGGHGLVVEPTEFDMDLVCDGTGTELGVGFLFSGFYVKIHSDGTFAFKQYDELFGALRFGGTLGGASGTGTELAAIPGLTKQFAGEACSSGDVTWRAHPPAGAPVRSASGIGILIRLDRDRSGHVTESITKN